MKAWLLAALALSAVGCHKADGLVVVDVSTTLSLTAPIDHLGVELTSPYGDTTIQIGSPPITLPTSFGMLVAKRFDAAITVTVTAFDVDYRVLASGVGTGSASKGERSTVKVVLDQLPAPDDMSIVGGVDLGSSDLLPTDDSGL